MFEEFLDKVRSIRLHITVSAVLCVVLGIVFLIWPAQVTSFVAYAIGVILIFIGAVQIISKIVSDENRSSGLLVGLLVLIIGIWILLHPATTISLIPIVIGVVMVVSGVQNLSLAITAKNVNASRWGWMIASAVLTIVFGIICIGFAFGLVKLVMRIVGVMLIYDGISSMLMVHHVNVAERAVDSVILKEEDVDDFV